MSESIRERWGLIQGVVTWSAPDPTLLVPTPGPILLVPTPALPSSFLLQTHTTCKPALTPLFVARYMHAHCPGMVKFHNGLLGGYLRDFVLCKGTMNAHITHRRHTQETHTGGTHRRHTRETHTGDTHRRHRVSRLCLHLSCPRAYLVVTAL